ncbi:MAG: LysM peptidoglycan-binding domain-containing M23 family metallopeptidase [Alphaproteobacteria bacterium]
MAIGGAASSQGNSGADTRNSPRIINGQRIVVAKSGDTVARLAKRAGVSERGIIRLNNLERPYRIAPGQRLLLPTAMVHVVGPGEQVADIAKRYRVAKKWLILLNGLRAPYRLRPGQRLFLPKSDRRAARVRERPVERTATRIRAPQKSRTKTIQPVRRKMKRARKLVRLTRKARTRRIGKPPALSGRGFAWPLRGRILRRYGRRGRGYRNDGINIAARAGSIVRAAENGVVVYAGSDVANLGEVLLIKHARGWVTAYAHNDRLLVGRGRVVRRGQAIARVGTTGAVLRPQLHFEIRKGAQPINPLRKLRRRQRALARR